MRSWIVPLSSCALALSLLVPGASRASDLEPALARLSSLEGDAYVEARRTLLEKQDVTGLRARVERAAWTDASWRTDAVAAFALAHLEKPEAEGVLDTLPGLSPARYLEMRRPEPVALRDLRVLLRRGDVTAPHLAERLLKTLERTPTSSPADFPARFAKEAPRLIAEERAALVDGLVLALGGTQHPVAAFALREVALEGALAARHRALAASALGQTRAPFVLATLDELLGDDAPDVREGAVVGLGRIASLAAVDRLSLLAQDPRHKALRVVVTGALGRAGSRFAHRAAPTPESERVREAAARVLVEMLGRAESDREVTAAIEGLSMVAHQSARPALVAALAKSPDGRYPRALQRLDRALARGR